MRVNFRNRTITLKNEDAENKKHFSCHWNGYGIDATKEDGTWDGIVEDSDKDCVHDVFQAKNLTVLVQECFDAIDKDIDYMEEVSSNYLKMLRPFRCYRKEIKCPMCSSKKIFKFRLDSDWASGSGDYFAINKDDNYTKEELNYDSFDRPDIEVYHCGDCGKIFE